MNEKQRPTGGATARPSLMSAPRTAGGAGLSSTSPRVLADLGGTPAAAGRHPRRRTAAFLGVAIAMAGLVGWVGRQQAPPAAGAAPVQAAPEVPPPPALATPPSPAQIVAAPPPAVATSPGAEPAPVDTARPTKAAPATTMAATRPVAKKQLAAASSKRRAATTRPAPRPPAALAARDARSGQAPSAAPARRKADPDSELLAAILRRSQPARAPRR